MVNISDHPHPCPEPSGSNVKGAEVDRPWLGQGQARQV